MTELMEALESLLETKKRHDEEREKCREDWSYFGFYEIERLKKAQMRFQDAINALIDERIEQKTRAEK